MQSLHGFIGGCSWRLKRLSHAKRYYFFWDHTLRWLRFDENFNRKTKELTLSYGCEPIMILKGRVLFIVRFFFVLCAHDNCVSYSWST